MNAGKMDSEQPEGPIREHGLRLVSGRERTAKEVQWRLEQAGYGEQEIAQTIAWLQRLQALDDTRAARLWVETRIRSRPMGRLRLQYELQRRGVDADVITGVIDEALGDESQEQDLAQRVLERHLASTRHVSPERRMRRLTNLLRRRGFSWPVIRQALKEATGEVLDSDL